MCVHVCVHRCVYVCMRVHVCDESRKGTEREGKDLQGVERVGKGRGDENILHRSSRE